MKTNACDYHNQKYYQGVQQSKELPGIPQFKGLPRSIIFKTTTGECQNQNYYQEGPQQKDCQGVPQTKLHSNELQRRITDKILSGSIAIKMTARKHHNKRYCKVVPQTKVLPVSFTITRADKVNHYQNYRQA